MGVTELAALCLKESGDPRDKKQFLSYLNLAANHQAAWSGYPLIFLTDYILGEEASETKHAVLYIVSGWASVQSHYEWIASEKNQEIMRELGPIMDVKELLHLDQDFGPIRKLLEDARDGVVVMSRSEDMPEQGLGGWALDGDKKAFVRFSVTSEQEVPGERAVYLDVGDINPKLD